MSPTPICTQVVAQAGWCAETETASRRADFGTSNMPLYRPTSACRVWPNSAQICPTAGQIWSIPGQSWCRFRAKIGRLWASFDRFRTTSLAELGPNVVDPVESRGRRQNLGRFRATLAKVVECVLKRLGTESAHRHTDTHPTELPEVASNERCTNVLTYAASACAEARCPATQWVRENSKREQRGLKPWIWTKKLALSTQRDEANLATLLPGLIGPELSCFTCRRFSPTSN